MFAVEDVAFIDAADVGGGGVAGGAAPGDASAQSRDPTAAKREENSRHRSTALRWIAQDPLGMMLVMRLGMSPICAAMDKYLSCAGKRWGRKQEAHAAQAFARGAVPGPAACRAFRSGELLDGLPVYGPLQRWGDMPRARRQQRRAAAELAAVEHVLAFEMKRRRMDNEEGRSASSQGEAAVAAHGARLGQQWVRPWVPAASGATYANGC